MGAHWPEPGGGIVGIPAGATELVATLSMALRLEPCPVALLIDRPAATLRFTAGRALDLAATQPYGITVDAAPHDPRVEPLTAALRLSAALMRRRSPATWAALDALDAAAGNAESAARSLGVSGQAIRAHRRRGHHAATEFLVPLFATLLARP